MWILPVIAQRKFPIANNAPKNATPPLYRHASEIVDFSFRPAELNTFRSIGPGKKDRELDSKNFFLDKTGHPQWEDAREIHTFHSAILFNSKTALHIASGIGHQEFRIWLNTIGTDI
jgi:hypothetical protein